MTDLTIYGNNPWLGADFFQPQYKLVGHPVAIKHIAEKILAGLSEGTKIDLRYSKWTPKWRAIFYINGEPQGIIVDEPIYPKSGPLPASRGVRLHKRRKRRM